MFKCTSAQREAVQCLGLPPDLYCCRFSYGEAHAKDIEHTDGINEDIKIERKKIHPNLMAMVEAHNFRPNIYVNFRNAKYCECCSSSEDNSAGLDSEYY